MILIRQASLAYKAGNSDELYQVDLCQVEADQYVVNFRFGRRGKALQEGSKTVLPVSQKKAEKIFDDLVFSKKTKGYWEDESGPFQEKLVAELREKGTSSREEAVLTQLRTLVQEERRGSLRPLERLIWRAGEMRLKEASTLLLELAGTTKPMVNYCLAWSLGRCGDETAMPFLRDLYMNHENPGHVRHMAIEAYRALSSRTARVDFLDGIAHGLPPAIKKEYFEGPQDAFEEALKRFLEKAAPEDFSVLTDLYLLDSKRARSAILKIIKEASFTANYFKQIRRIFKAAEFRSDGEVFGILVHRLETLQPTTITSKYNKSGLVAGQYYENIYKEFKKPNSQAAYTSSTRLFFRRRAWRTLRRMGELGDKAYVPMAVGVLADITDANLQATQRTDDLHTNINQENNNVPWHAYRSFYTFNYILYGNSPRYKPKGVYQLTWCYRSDKESTPPSPDQREESFPHLWDEQPNGLLHLISDSHCQLVHEFAVKALRANDDFCTGLGIDIIKMMLSTSYHVTQQLAVELAEKKFNPASPDIELVLALLSCSFPEAHTLAISWVNQYSGPFIPFVDFWVQVSLLPYADVRRMVRDNLSRISFTPSQAQALLNRFLDQLIILTDENLIEIAAEVGETLRLTFSSLLRQLDMALIEKLLSHPFSTIQAFAGYILLDHNIKVEQLPGDILKKLSESPDEKVRGVGLRLFGQLSVMSLITKQDMVLGFCLSPHSDVRQAARPILEKIVPNYSQFGVLLSQTLVYHLLKKEPGPHFYHDAIETLTSVLSGSLYSINKELVLRMIKSRSTRVQVFGGYVLRHHFRSISFSVREIVILMNVAVQAIRELGQQWCREEIYRFKQDIGDTVRLLDSTWEDTREFAFSFFRNHLTHQDLTPAVLVTICDSVNPQVQQFGCDLITRLFTGENGEEYLLQLSQHPSTNMQLFVTNYLSRYAAGSIQRFQELYDYFVTVLSGVNKGRVARQRIFSFFKEESLKNQEIAAIITQVITRVSLTISIKDKARCIEIMRDISHQYPELNVPLIVKPIEVRQGGHHAI